jgi:hypothetical protein
METEREEDLKKQKIGNIYRDERIKKEERHKTNDKRKNAV